MDKQLDWETPRSRRQPLSSSSFLSVLPSPPCPLHRLNGGLAPPVTIMRFCSAPALNY